ncbi:haloacid dehalogenase-like hydrolase family protein [Histomonas meleagridis]|uniref:haloacid dehalogenase-like hydrolase family protein n=1 Tax=Histomonas meleagridis TaxID=135588 RepID=UPI00355AA327|nr:haloacid dehalogenase-like hydrolase family protein [Histomonas meleagridis]KAH0796234.1 haloacid dehalogenase-like hydrolase family protein [Histomonas meleagridis]
MSKKVVIIDADGCIINSESVNRSVHTKLTGRTPSQELRNRVKGLSNFEAWKIICAEYKLKETPEEIIQKRDEILKTIYPTIPLKPGVEEFVAELEKRAIPFCITASCNRAHLNLKLSGHKDIMAKAKFIITNEGDMSPKPSPDLFSRAAQNFPQIANQDFIVIEDSVKGIQSAQSLNMQTVFVSSSPAEGCNALIIINSLEHFPYHLLE